jgi:RNA polymerase primary sigma factor
MRYRRNGDRNPGLARLCQFDVLSIDEERRLFGRLRAVRAETLRMHDRTSPQKDCRRRAAESMLSDEATQIRNRIVECNLRLVVSLAKRYAAPDRSLEDLVSEAALPLMNCVDSFDPRRGTRFSTYATRALMNLFGKLRRRDSRRRTRFSNGERWKQVPAREGRSTSSEGLIRAEDLNRLGDRLSNLPARELVLVAERYGLTGDRRPRTFRELGARHGLSKERVRVITCQAISRLRESPDESQPP